MDTWSNCKNVLIIRADNMGDVLMSSPAIRAIKESFKCRITLLTSRDAAHVVSLLPTIDETIIADLPWVKTQVNSGLHQIDSLVSELRNFSFEACIIFTVYSQSPLPAAMLAWMAGIPKRLAYCRENPYGLLNYWIPEKEPYELIKHQVERDLDLVERIGAVTREKKIIVTIRQDVFSKLTLKMQALGVDLTRPFIVLHPGVSEEKRQFPEAQWKHIARKLQGLLNTQIIVTGSRREKALTNRLKKAVEKDTFSAGGLFSIEEFAALLKMARFVISVNTLTIHLAAAVETPQVVLYAQTNPQHHPWMAKAKMLEYSIDEETKSKNEVVRYVDRKHYADYLPLPSVDDIVKSALLLW